MPFRAYTKGLVLLKDLRDENHFKRGFNAFSGLHGGLVLLKDLSEPLMLNRT